MEAGIQTVLKLLGALQSYQSKSSKVLTLSILGVDKSAFWKSNQISNQIKGLKNFQIKPQIKSQCQKTCQIKPQIKSGCSNVHQIKSQIKPPASKLSQIKSQIKSQPQNFCQIKSQIAQKNAQIKSQIKPLLKLTCQSGCLNTPSAESQKGAISQSEFTEHFGFLRNLFDLGPFANVSRGPRGPN